MIEIGAKTKFKILDSTKIEQLTEDNSVLLGKYDCFLNTAMGNVWCHNRDFGHGYNSILSQFMLKEGYLHVHCTSDYDMTTFKFNDSDLKHMRNTDKECARYTINYLKKLYESGIIENPDK